MVTSYLGSELRISIYVSTTYRSQIIDEQIVGLTCFTPQTTQAPLSSSKISARDEPRLIFSDAAIGLDELPAKC